MLVNSEKVETTRFPSTVAEIDFWLMIEFVEVAVCTVISPLLAKLISIFLRFETVRMRGVFAKHPLEHIPEIVND